RPITVRAARVHDAAVQRRHDDRARVSLERYGAVLEHDPVNDVATLHVIHSDRDRRFVEEWLLPPLPAFGFTRWTSELLNPPGSPYPATRPTATLVVVSPRPDLTSLQSVARGLVD